MANWNFQRVLTAGFGYTQVKTSPTGTSLVYSSGDIWRSIDGGATWTLITTVPNGGDGTFAYMGSGIWALMNAPGVGPTVSTTDGATWPSGLSLSPNQSRNGASDGAGTAIFIEEGVAGLGLWTTDHGVTWNNSGGAWPFAAVPPPGALIWDGTQFVVYISSGGGAGDFYTAPSGFSQGAGPTWTHVGSFTNGIGAPSAGDGALTHDPSVGYVAGGQSGGSPAVFIASTVAGLLTATPTVPTVVAANTLASLGTTAANIIVAASAGYAEHSTDGGTTWAADNFNFSAPVFSPENCVSISYDITNGQLIALGSQGSVSTLPLSVSIMVPDVVGLSQAAATTAITGAGFTLGTVTTAHDPIVPFGYVISQSPLGGTLHAPASPVNILVSLGIATVTVPNVVGFTLAAATTALTGAGLIIGTLTSVASGLPLGNIAAESPVAGTVVAVGSAVDLKQSNGLIPVPNVVGDQLNIAENVITAAGLVVGPITPEIIGGLLPGTVAGQSPSPGVGVLPGSAVSLTSVSSITNAYDVTPTVISQYANSPTLLRLIENMAQYIDPSTNFLNFFTFVWNVNTAVGFGLDIWGRIVGVSRVLPISGASDDFGFHNSDTPQDWEPFNQGPFYTGASTTGAFTLPDDAYRVLILTKALANITATNAQALNQLVRNLFPGRGKCYVQDLGGMAMSYVFEFALTTIEYAILTQSGVLPHPAGVLVSVVVVPGTDFVGFTEAGPDLYQPFGYGQFYIPGE